jgi:hypothetical protein
VTYEVLVPRRKHENELECYKKKTGNDEYTALLNNRSVRISNGHPTAYNISSPEQKNTRCPDNDRVDGKIAVWSK